MNKENCALKLVDEIILQYDAQSIKTSNSALNKITVVLKATIRREHQMPPQHHQPHFNKGHTSTSSEVYSASLNYLPQM